MKVSAANVHPASARASSAASSAANCWASAAGAPSRRIARRVAREMVGELGGDPPPLPRRDAAPDELAVDLGEVAHPITASTAVENRSQSRLAPGRERRPRAVSW